MPNSFTPQQIEDFLQEFFDTVGARQYIGARYVPIFGRAGEDTVEWDDGAPYEPLTVVMHLGVSYVSRRYVPQGIQITDTEYWVETYRFNAQVEQYRQEVLGFQGQIDEIREDYVPFPDELTLPKYGTLGQVLTTLANGATMWEDPVTVDADVAEPLIEAWLDDHPEATTTVQDGSITDAKLNDSSTIIRRREAGNLTDLNDAVTSGFYILPYGTTIDNCPIDANIRARILLVYNASSQYVIQSVSSMAGITYWRYKTSSTPWVAWRTLTVDNSMMGSASVGTTNLIDGSITDAKIHAKPYTSDTNPTSIMTVLPLARSSVITDLDDITETCFLELGSETTYANCPIASGTPRFLVTYQASQAFYVQIITALATGQVYMRWHTTLSGWSDWRTTGADFGFRGKTYDNPDATDADTLLASGYWRVNNSGDPTYTANIPTATANGTLYTFNFQDGFQAVQVYSEYGGHIYTRYRSGNPATWKAWTDVTRFIPFNGYAPLTAETTFDANTVFTYGYWRVIAQGTVANLPSTTGTFLSLPTESLAEASNKQMTQFFMDWTTNKLWTRRFSGGAWRKWVDLTAFKPERLPDYLDAPKPYTGTPPSNAGNTFRVMTYNVCQYDNDGSTDISDERLANLKAMIMRANCDYLFWQESTPTINDNGDNDKLASEFVFNPMYPFSYVGNYNSINSRDDNFASSATTSRYPNSPSGESGSQYVHATITLGTGESVSVYNVHPKAGYDDSSLAIRARQWQDLADILDADTATYKMVCGDFNTMPEDYQTFDTIFSGYKRANGGYLGWYDTTGRYKDSSRGTEYPCDNILLSDNMEFRFIDVYVSWYDLLWSDHIPIVAEIALHPTV